MEHFRERAERDLNDVEARQFWSRAVALDGDFAEAEKVLAAAPRGTGGRIPGDA